MKPVKIGRPRVRTSIEVIDAKVEANSFKQTLRAEPIESSVQLETKHVLHSARIVQTVFPLFFEQEKRSGNLTLSRCM